MFPTKWCSRITISVGLFFALAGLAVLLSWSVVFENAWEKNLELRPTSESHAFWIKTPMPLYIELYLFNWTNSEEFMRDASVKPSFEEIGPFVFREIHERVNVTWNRNNNTLTYNQARTWIFQPDKSKNLSTPITNLNVVLTAIAKAVANRNLIVKGLIDFLIFFYKEKLIITRPASQWLFEGMQDNLLDFMKKVNAGSVPFDKFGWFYGRNESSTYDGVFTIRSGKESIYEMGSLSAWNYRNETKYFDGECGAIRGTTSEIFAPLKKEQNNLTIFISDFCGPFTLAKSGFARVQGLEGYTFVGGEDVFDNGTLHSEAKCFCAGSCPPSGARNETLCFGAPVFISFPHFYLADPVYLESIKGINPNKSEHEFRLTLHPLSGLPLEVRAQLQINVLLEPIPFIPAFATVPKIYIPMVWFRQRIELTEALASMGLKLETSEKLGYGVGSCLLLLGILLAGIEMFRLNLTASERDELLVPPRAESSETRETDEDEQKHQTSA